MKQKKLRARPRQHLPLADLLPSGEVIVLYGERRMTVQGCRKILSYSPGEICLRLKHRTVRILGEGLMCSSFSGGCTTLQGRIRSVTYQALEKEEHA